MNKTASLDSLANELILSIIQYLDHPSLSNLNQTNHRFHNLSHTALYTTFTGHEYGLFLRTICTSPAAASIQPGNTPLAHIVKSVKCSIQRSKHHYDGHTWADRIAIQSAFRELDLPDKEVQEDLLSNYRIYDNLTQYHWYMDFFLSFFPQVEELEIAETWQWDDHQYWFRSIAANADYFACLGKVTIHGPLRVKNALPLFVLPALREVLLSQVVETRRAAGATWEWEEGAGGGGAGQSSLEERLSWGSNVEKLVLKESYITTEDLVPVLKSIKALKHFEYHHVENSLAEPGDVQVAHSHLIDALDQHASTLEYLSLQEQESEAGGLTAFVPYQDDAAPTFPRLRVLDLGITRVAAFESVGYNISMEFWVRRIMDHLPSHLHTLRLAFIGVDPDDEQKRIAEARFLSLWEDGLMLGLLRVKEIRMISPLFGSDSDRGVVDGLEAIERTWADAGVKFTCEGWRKD